MTIRAVEDNQAEVCAILNLTEVSGRKIEFDYLRAFVITLVLFVHAALAYTTSAFINPENPIATSSPVVNEQRWIGFDLIVALNESGLAPLMKGIVVFIGTLILSWVLVVSIRHIPAVAKVI